MDLILDGCSIAKHTSKKVILTFDQPIRVIEPSAVDDDGGVLFGMDPVRDHPTRNEDRRIPAPHKVAANVPARQRSEREVIGLQVS